MLNAFKNFIIMVEMFEQGTVRFTQRLLYNEAGSLSRDDNSDTLRYNHAT